MRFAWLFSNFGIHLKSSKSQPFAKDWPQQADLHFLIIFKFFYLFILSLELPRPIYSPINYSWSCSFWMRQIRQTLTILKGSWPKKGHRIEQFISSFQIVSAPQAQCHPHRWSFQAESGSLKVPVSRTDLGKQVLLWVRMKPNWRTWWKHNMKAIQSEYIYMQLYNIRKLHWLMLIDCWLMMLFHVFNCAYLWLYVTACFSLSISLHSLCITHESKNIASQHWLAFTTILFGVIGKWSQTNPNQFDFLVDFYLALSTPKKRMSGPLLKKGVVTGYSLQDLVL